MELTNEMGMTVSLPCDNCSAHEEIRYRNPRHNIFKWLCFKCYRAELKRLGDSLYLTLGEAKTKKIF